MIPGDVPARPFALSDAAMRILPLIAALALPLAGCATVPTPPQGLSDTSWRFVSFTGTDDAQNMIVTDGRPYALTFHGDGRVTGQLDCNRLTGSWNEGALGGKTVSLYLSPMAMTRMACPPGSFDIEIAGMLPDVASYKMAKGDLRLALKMDQGTLAFEPLEN